MDIIGVSCHCCRGREGLGRPPGQAGAWERGLFRYETGGIH